jgi:hypothetical protein
MEDYYHYRAKDLLTRHLVARTFPTKRSDKAISEIMTELVRVLSLRMDRATL